MKLFYQVQLSVGQETCQCKSRFSRLCLPVHHNARFTSSLYSKDWRRDPGVRLMEYVWCGVSWSKLKRSQGPNLGIQGLQLLGRISAATYYHAWHARRA